MAHPAPLRPSAPSTSLLRFLRSQSNGHCFSACKSAAFPQCHGSRLYSSTTLCPSWVANGRGTPNTPGRKSTLDGPTSDSPYVSSTRTISRKLGSLSGGGCLSNRSPERVALRIQIGSHSFSTTTKRDRNLLRRLFSREQQASHAQLKPDDLPPNGASLEEGYEGNIFNTGRALAVKAANEPRLRCTELDGNGNVTLVSGEFKKSELIAKVCTNSVAGVAIAVSGLSGLINAPCR
jgi:magnesium transporter